jgi:hypothetical protein
MHGPKLRECPEAEGIVKLLNKSEINRGPKRIDFSNACNRINLINITSRVIYYLIRILNLLVPRY